MLRLMCACSENDFVYGFIKGAKETPKGYFAPVIAIWRLLIEVSESLTKDKPV